MSNLRSTASATATADRCAAINDRLAARLRTPSPFTDLYRYMLTTPGKRLRAQLVLACHGIDFPASTDPLTESEALDLACAVEMLHEATLIHDDICDGSTIRRDAPSAAARYGVRMAAYAGLHLAGMALAILAEIQHCHPRTLSRAFFRRDGIATQPVSDLSFGQIVECLPPLGADPVHLRHHYRTVAIAKTGTLFRLACTYSSAGVGAGDQQLHALAAYADHLAVAFQIIDDIRDLDPARHLGKPIGTDVAQGIATWPVIEWLSLQSGSAAVWHSGVGESAAGDVAGGPASRDLDTSGLCARILASGAGERARRAAAKEIAAAHRALTVIPAGAGRDDLTRVCSSIMDLP